MSSETYSHSQANNKMTSGRERAINFRSKCRDHVHVVTTFWTEVYSAAQPTSKDTGRGRSFFVKLHENLPLKTRKTRSNISGQECLTSFFSRYQRWICV